jgi:hypothetical protein
LQQQLLHVHALRLHRLPLVQQQLHIIRLLALCLHLPVVRLHLHKDRPSLRSHGVAHLEQQEWLLVPAQQVQEELSVRLPLAALDATMTMVQRISLAWLGPKSLLRLGVQEVHLQRVAGKKNNYLWWYGERVD